MIEPFFKKSDFTLCDVPVPKGYPQSQTHCSVLLYDGVYYLTTSPYPVPLYPYWLRFIYAALKKITFGKYDKFIRGEDFENPCIYRGIISSEKEFPTKFELMEGSPLMKKPEDKYGYGSYCSDPDLYIEGNDFYVLNRTSYRKKEIIHSVSDYEIYTHLIKGTVYSNAFKTNVIKCLFECNDGSPCITKMNGKYYMFSIKSSSYNTGMPCEAIFRRESESIEGCWSEVTKIDFATNGFEPWHMSVFKYKQKLYAIVACVKSGETQRCYQMLGVFSENLSSLHIFQKPLTDFNSYRGAALVRKDGEFVLYNTTVHEKIIGGKSIDGREIMMAHTGFERLLNEVALLVYE